MSPSTPKDGDGPAWLAAYRSAPKGVWLVATAARDADAPIDQPYPHIHGLEVPGAAPVNGRVPRYSRKECAACAGADAPVKPRVWRVPAEPDRTPRTVGAEWRFACLLCGQNGHADSDSNAQGLLNLHLIEACPATAPSEAEFEERQIVRQVLVDLYHREVPPYDQPYRPHSWFD